MSLKTQARYEQAVAEWAKYCQRFGLAPEQVIGKTYPGYEFFPVTKDMAAHIGVKMRMPE